MTSPDAETPDEPTAPTGDTPPCMPREQAERLLAEGRSPAYASGDHPAGEPSTPLSICERDDGKPLLPFPLLLGGAGLAAGMAAASGASADPSRPPAPAPSPQPGQPQPPEQPRPPEPKPPANGEGPVPVPVPADSAPPHLTLPTGQGPHALFTTGRVTVGGLRAGASWSYSLDGGTTWTAGHGASLPVTALGESGSKQVLLKQVEPDGRDGRVGTQDFELRAVPDVPALVGTNTGQTVISASGWITLTDLDGGIRWEYSLDGGNVWQPGQASRIDPHTLQEGANLVLVRQVDDLGQVGGAGAIAMSLDTSALAPRIALMHDTGTAGDAITAEGTVTVAGIEAGATWAYSLDGGATWKEGHGDTIPANDFGTAAVDRDLQVMVRQTDGVGNVSASASLAFTLLKTLPMLTAGLANDTGASAQDHVTQDASLTITGVEADARVQFRLTGSQAWQEGRVDALFGADGVYTVELRQIDDHGRASPVTTLTFTLDTAAAAPSLTLNRDTGVDATDRVTSDATLLIGNLERDARWAFSLDGVHFTAGSGDRLDASLLPASGDISVWVRQTDAAGNTSTDTQFSMHVRNEAPAIDLREHAGIQDQRRLAIDRTQSNAGMAITETTAPLFDGPVQVLHIAVDGPALDLINDRLVLDRELLLDARIASQGVTLGGVRGLSYRFDPATRDLSIWREDGAPLSGADAAAVTNSVLLRNGQHDPLIGERTFTITAEDLAGNRGAPGVVTIVVDPRQPALDLNGMLSGRDASSAVRDLGAGVPIFASGLTVSHENPDATIERVRIALTGRGASRDDRLVSHAGGTDIDLSGAATDFTVGGVGWHATRASDTFLLALADGSQATLEQTRAMLDSLRLRNPSNQPLQGDRTFTVTIVDHNDRGSTAVGTVLYDTVAPQPDLNGARTGIDRSVAVTPGLPWAFAVADPANAQIAETGGVTRLTLRFDSALAGAFDGASASRGEWIGLFDELHAQDRSGMLRLGANGTLTSSSLIPGKTITMTLSGSAHPVLNIDANIPLTQDEATQLLRSLYYTAEAGVALGGRTVAIEATDRAGNTTANDAVATLDVRATNTPVIHLPHGTDTGAQNNDGVTRNNGSAQAPLQLQGFAPAGQTVTVFRDADGNGVWSAGETVGTTVAGSDGRWYLTLANATLADGVHQFGVVANNVTSSLLEITVDTRPPASAVAIGDTVGPLPALAGNTDPLMLVTVEIDTDNNAANGYEVRYVTRADQAGRWALDTATAQPASGQTHEFHGGDKVNVRVTTQDLAGNTTERTASSVVESTQFSISDAHVIEGSDGTREMVFLVHRGGDITGTGSVRFTVDPSSSAKAVLNGALADNDYAGVNSGQLDFAAGEDSKLVRYTINGDNYREVNDKLVLRLDQAQGGQIGDGLGIGNINEVDIGRLQAAYGLRDLNPRQNDFAVRVRRSSDNAEMDIGFNANGELDRQALLSFVGTGTTAKGYVTRWYDQSGHGRDLVQATVAKQGVIVDGGQIVTRADGSVGISFNNSRNGGNDDFMAASGVAATDWKSAVIYAKVQSEGGANGTLFNLSDPGNTRLSSSYPESATGYVFDVGLWTRADDRLSRPVGANQTLTGKSNDIVFEAHSDNTTAGTPSLNYTDARQAIFENGVQVASDATLSSTFTTTTEWKLAWHGMYPGNVDSNYYQQAMYNEFLVYLAKDNSTPTIQTLQGSGGDDVLTYSGEASVTAIDGLAGRDTLYLSGSANLDFSSMPGGVKGLEQIWMANGSDNTLTLSRATLELNGANTLTVRLDASDAVVLDGQRFAHADGVDTVVIGNAEDNRVTGLGSGGNVLIGGAGTDTFVWTRGQAGEDIVQDYTFAQGDRIDLTNLLIGFTTARQAAFLRKAVDDQGHVSIEVDADGQGNFQQPDLTIHLRQVLSADAITVLTPDGTKVL